MPTMEAQVQRVHFTESEEEHEEDEPRQNGTERHKPLVAQGADDHREPQRVTIEKGPKFRHVVITTSV